MKEKIKTTCLILITISIILFAIIYVIRTFIDIGCAKTTTEEDSLRRRFFDINCWSWERTFHLQYEVNINW